MTGTSGRRVVANMLVTLDGRYAGPAGPLDMSIVMPYAITDVARDHLTGLWESATTALLGRTNAEGFLGYWPPVADQPDADERDRRFARWLVDVEKVVLSSTLSAPPWERTRVVDAPAAEVVRRLRAEAGGDVVVLSSASVITALLAADEVDRLALTLTPQITGSGPRLLDDGLPGSRWELASERAGDHGALCLVYDRLRDA